MAVSQRGTCGESYYVDQRAVVKSRLFVLFGDVAMLWNEGCELSADTVEYLHVGRYTCTAFWLRHGAVSHRPMACRFRLSSPVSPVSHGHLSPRLCLAFALRLP